MVPSPVKGMKERLEGLLIPGLRGQAGFYAYF